MGPLWVFSVAQDGKDRNSLTARSTNNPGEQASGDEHRASPLAALRRPGAAGLILHTVRPNGYIWGCLVYQLQDGYFTAPLFDAQGTTRWQFSFQGASFYVTQLNYDAFGNLVSIPPAQPEPLKFVGHYGYYTDATGFVYVRNRYYDPVNGTWISRDPLGFGGRVVESGAVVGIQPFGTVDASGLVPVMLRANSNAAPAMILPAPCIFFQNPCVAGSLAILSDWQDSWNKGFNDRGKPWNKGGVPWQHVCNPPYSHCMACCTLSRFSDADCALEVQNLQDMTFSGGAAKRNARTAECVTGKVSAVEQGSCHDNCSAFYHN